MIQIDEKELQVLIELASRTPKTITEQYALETIVDKWNAQLREEQLNQATQAEKVKEG